MLLAASAKHAMRKYANIKNWLKNMRSWMLMIAPQLSEHVNKSVVACIIFGAIAIYAIVAVLG